MSWSQDWGRKRALSFGREARTGVVSCFSLLSCPRPRRARTHGRRLLFDRFHPLRESGIRRIIFLCRACVYTSTFTQKIQCTFKVDIPDMGHLDGGHERDVRTVPPCQTPRTRPSPSPFLTSTSDQSPKQDPTAALARLHSHLFVRLREQSRTAAAISPLVTPLCALQGLRGFYRPTSVQLARPERAQCRG